MMTVILKNATEMQVNKYCDDLRAAMLKGAREQIDMTVEMEVDSDMVENYEGSLLDSIYWGHTITIKMGRPAKSVVGQTCEQFA